MVLDIILILIVVMFFIGGFTRGFTKTLLGLVGMVASTIIAFILFKPVAEALKKMPEVNAVIKQITDVVANSIMPNTGFKVDVPAFLSGIVSTSSIDGTIKTGTTQIATAIANYATDIAIMILLVIAVKIAINIAIFLSSIITNLPGIKFVDRFFGGFVGIAYGVVVAYIFCAVLFVFSASNQQNVVNDMVSQSMLAPYVYSNNILVNLFVKKPPILN